jgi:ribosomal protein S18 acetylase RimI-like enzyme
MLAKGQRLAIAAAVISFMVFVLTVYGTYRLGLTFSNEFMETLAQINATVFALAFTIPLAASQFARYQTRPESFFDKTNLLYFLAYAVAIFFPILAGTNATSHFVAVGLSAMCLSLLIPFLFRTARKLTPKQIIGEEYGKVIRAWKDEESFAEYGSSIENIARAALKMKDYTTFNTAVESMISLVRVSMNLPAQISYGPQQPGAAGLQQAVVRIGEDSLDDRFALKIWCAWLLGLATRKHFKIENGASILKYVEYLVLSETLLLSSRKPESQHFLAKCLIEWAIFNQYPNDADADKEISRCAASLITLPQESVDEAIQDSQKRMEQSPLLGPVGPLPFGDIPNLRMHLDEMLSRLTVRTSEFFVSRKIGKLTALPADTRTLVAGPDDVSDITMLQRVCYLLEAKARKDWSTPELTEMPQDLKNEMTQSIVLKAALGGVTIGSVRGRMERKSCYISRLFVHPAFRRHGIGTRLLTEIETHFPAANALVTYLGTGEAQKIAFIRNRGYAVSEQHTLTNGLTYVYMKRTGAGIIG